MEDEDELADRLRAQFGECQLCSEPFRPGEPGYKFDWDDGDTAKGCKECVEEYPRCQTPTCRLRSEFLREVYPGSTFTWSSSIEVCTICISSDYYLCYGCDSYFTSLENGSEYCGECYACDCYECECRYCYPEGCECECNDYADCVNESNGPIHGYGYKPTPIFHDISGRTYYPDNDQTIYLGMELEIGKLDSYDARSSAELLNNELIYCKHDSSVDGIEMVTHPMSLEYARENLPFQDLRNIRENYGASAWKHGLHVHVNRTAFTNDTHVFRWLKLIYRNKVGVERIARRSSDQWASFSEHERKQHTITANKTGRTVKGSRYASPARYVAVNTLNNATLEVRVFRGSLRQDEIMSALEMVHASVEYTRYLTTTDVLRNSGWHWERFIAWADLHGEKYRNLVTLNYRDMEGIENVSTNLLSA